MTDASLWQNIWFILVVAAFAIYSALDGFDLGAGMVLPFVARTDDEKRAVMAALAPVWDGNEVWLIIGGGCLFAAFAPAFAGVLSGFYTAVCLAIVALAVRATSFEFWSHTRKARALWERLFAVSSFLIPLLLMVALGNALQGIALDSSRRYHGGLVSLLRPLPLIMGVMGVSVAALHGLVFLWAKAADQLAARASGAARRLFWVVQGTVVVFMVSATALVPAPARAPVVWAGMALTALCMIVLFIALKRRAGRLAIAMSSAAILSLWVTIAGFQWPWLVRSSTIAGAGYSIIGDSSSEHLLRTLAGVTLPVLALVAVATLVAYRIFRGKVDESGGY